MLNIPKKVFDRLSKALPKFQRIVKTALDKDVGEYDTVYIVNDILQEIFGYEKIIEITSELNIKGTYCDLAIKIDDAWQYLIECKAVGINLKDDHIRQAVNYGVTKGIPWVILTNAVKWDLYKIRFEQPVHFDLVISFDFDQLNPRNNRDMELLYVLSKEGLEKNAREVYSNKVENVNKFVIGNLILNENILSVIKKELKKFSPDVRIDINDILEILKNQIIKREIIEHEKAKIAQDKIKKFYKKIEKQKNKKEDLKIKENENDVKKNENFQDKSVE